MATSRGITIRAKLSNMACIYHIYNKRPIAFFTHIILLCVIICLFGFYLMTTSSTLASVARLWNMYHNRIKVWCVYTVHPLCVLWCVALLSFRPQNRPRIFNNVDEKSVCPVLFLIQQSNRKFYSSVLHTLRSALTSYYNRRLILIHI